MSRAWVVLGVILLAASCGAPNHDFGGGDGESGGPAAGTHQGGKGESPQAGNDTGGTAPSDGGASSNAGTTSGDAGSSDPVGGGGAGDGGAPPAALDCGDGQVQAPEECDDGKNNGAGKACNAGCKKNVCGDGDVGPGEGCDDGKENGFELLRCAPDCSRIIETKHIKLSAERQGANLQPNPVATADAACETGYKSLFAYGTTRRATTTANKVANPVDWVLRPYTYYVNSSENPIWLTDSVALLGIRDGKPTNLENAIFQATILTLTGLNANWTTLGADNCSGWSSSVDGYEKHYGFALGVDSTFLYSATTNGCSYTAAFYCVEQ